MRRRYHPPSLKWVRRQVAEHLRRTIPRLLFLSPLILFGLLAGHSAAADAILGWDDTNAPGVVRSFNLFRYGPGTNRARLASTTNAAARELVDTNFNRSVTNIYSVTASNGVGEAESPKLILQPLLAPFNLANRYSARTWTIPPAGVLQRSRDLATWEEHLRNMGTNSMIVRVRERAEFPNEFYRVATNAPLLPPLPGGAP